MATTSRKFNWFMLAGGLVFMLIGLNQLGERHDKVSLKRITVKLSEDCRKITSKRNSNAFELRVKDYVCLFTLAKGTISGNQYSSIARLQQGDVIDVEIDQWDFYRLETGLDEVFGAWIISGR